MRIGKGAPQIYADGDATDQQLLERTKVLLTALMAVDRLEASPVIRLFHRDLWRGRGVRSPG